MLFLWARNVNLIYGINIFLLHSLIIHNFFWKCFEPSFTYVDDSNYKKHIFSKGGWMDIRYSLSSLECLNSLYEDNIQKELDVSLLLCHLSPCGIYLVPWFIIVFCRADYEYRSEELSASYPLPPLPQPGCRGRHVMRKTKPWPLLNTRLAI